MPFSKESRQSRGYGAEWVKIRKLVIERDKGLCQACLRNDRVTVGRDVDHITSKDEAKRLGWHQSRVDAMANLELLCVPCHKAKTVKENGGTYRPKVQIGLDGWPVGE